MLKGPTHKSVQPAFALISIQVLTGSDNSHGSYDGRTVLFLAAKIFFHGKQIMSQIKIICNIRSSNHPLFQDVV